MSYPWGADIGNFNVVVAVARRGGIDVLANEASSRQTPFLVGFTGKQRVSGEGAAAQWASNLKNTVSDVKELLGRKWDEPEVQKIAARAPYTMKKGPDGGILFVVDYDGREATFSPEQLMAIMLKNALKTAEDANKVPSPDAVLSVPVYYTDAQRRAMLDAAQIAGLNVLQLKNEPAAAALAFGLPKSLEFPDDSAEPQRVLFVDMGHHATTVSAVAFTKSKLQVLGTAFDRNLGGRDFDEILVSFFSDEFKHKTGLDLHTNAKSLFRMRAAVQKLKVALLGVPMMPLNVECLMGDHDFQSHMERDTFASLSQPLLDKMLEVVKQVLADTGLRFDQISSIQLVGSTTRLPFVVSTLKEFFGKEPARAINSEECIAKGCALAAAMISPVFKVRDFSVVDASPFVINLSWTGGKQTASEDAVAGAPTSGNVIFAKNNQLPCKKILTLTNTEAFEISASYGDVSQLPSGSTTFITHCTISNIPQIDKPKIKVSIRLDINGIVSIEEAVVYEDYEVEEEIPQTAAAPAPAPAAAAPAPAAAPAEGAAAPAADGDTPMQDSAAATPAAEGEKKEDGAEPMATDAAAAAAPEANSAPKRRIVKKKKKHVCAVKASTASLSNDAVKQLKEQEFNMASQDRWITETHDKRNELEAYVYDMRDRISGDLRDYVTDADRESFNTLLQQMEDWLYTDECSDAQKGQLQTKLDSLKTLGDPIVSRYNEENDRSVAVDKFKDAINEFRALANTKEEKYAHITDEERQKVLAECDACEQFLAEKLKAQESQPKHKNPAFRAGELSMRANQLANTVRPIMNRPKPKEEKKPEPAPAAAAPAAAAEGEAAAPAADGAAAATPAEGQPMDTTE